MNERGRAAGRDRMQQLRIKSVLAVQAGLAAALAWAAARWLTGMPSPIFAPDAGVQVHVVSSVVVHGRAAFG
ncbi:hypothetical protein ABZ328_18215 [Micromonospora aurantiaca]|uniref:hypothetical protein n=1 Tax=Micromonospora aurantiaca (nom. illeg.) TaxID=47850 RepID=UPI0033CAA097